MEKKLMEQIQSILGNAERACPFSKNNFVTSQKLIVFWLLGTDAAYMERVEQLLRKEVGEIISDERTVYIIADKRQEKDKFPLQDELNNALRIVSHNYLEISTDEIMICPVFLDEYFSSKEEQVQFTDICIQGQNNLSERNRNVVWHPFLFVYDEKVLESKESICYMKEYIRRLLDYGKEQKVACCSPCCVISNINEDGKEIMLEQKIRAVLMLMVFMNTEFENQAMLWHILKPIENFEEDLFFSARAVSVCEPVRSLTLSRLWAVHEYFSTFCVNDKLFEGMQYQFFKSEKWKERLRKLPHDDKDALLTAPVYSVIPRADNKQFNQVLQEFCNKYYLDIIKGKNTNADIYDDFWNDFWNEVFLKMGGSLETIQNLEKNKKEIIDRCPKLTVHAYSNAPVGDMRKGCENSLKVELENAQRDFLEEILRSDGKFLAEYDEKMDIGKEISTILERNLHNQILRLRQVELLLNTGGVHVSDSGEEAQIWFEELRNNEPRQMYQEQLKYQRVLYELFTNKTDKESALYKMLRICNEVIDGHLESREDYMQKKLNMLALHDMPTLLKKLNESWKLPVHLTGAIKADKEYLMVMGNPKNTLYQKLCDDTVYKVSYKNSRLDDRIEIVRLSARFNENNLYKDMDKKSGEMVAV